MTSLRMESTARYERQVWTLSECLALRYMRRLEFFKEKLIVFCLQFRRAIDVDTVGFMPVVWSAGWTSALGTDCPQRPTRPMRFLFIMHRRSCIVTLSSVSKTCVLNIGNKRRCFHWWRPELWVSSPHLRNTPLSRGIKKTTPTKRRPSRAVDNSSSSKKACGTRKIIIILQKSAAESILIQL
jgi:hypothetical protein